MLSRTICFMRMKGACRYFFLMSYKDLNKANISNMLSSKKLHHTWFSKAENLWCDSRNLEEDELDMWKLPQNLQLSQHCSYCHNVD
uniref:Uncharacterized protein n=1 Tax=Populus trichocarpa TaxID=3694 RepID=A0A2K2B1S5_POPTR